MGWMITWISNIYVTERRPGEFSPYGTGLILGVSALTSVAAP